MRGGSRIDRESDVLLADSDSTLCCSLIESITKEAEFGTVGEITNKFIVYEYLDIDNAELLTSFPGDQLVGADPYTDFGITLNPRQPVSEFSTISFDLRPVCSSRS